MEVAVQVVVTVEMYTIGCPTFPLQIRKAPVK